MMLLQTIGRLILKVRPVKVETEIPVAVRPITGLELAPRRTVRRLALVARVSAALAVRANVPKLKHLRSQHDIYRATAPRDVTAPIPETEIDSAGEFRIVPLADGRHPSDLIYDASSEGLNALGPVAAEAAYQRQASQAAGDVVARRLEEREGDMRLVERQLRDRDEQIERSETERSVAAIARAQAVAESAEGVAPPARVASPLSLIFWRHFEVATILGESMNCFAALANSAGLDPTNLSVEWRNGAAPSIVGWGVAALTISALLFVMTEWAFARIDVAIANLGDPKRLFRLITGTAALLFTTAVVAAIAYLRAQLGGAGEVSIGMACIYFIVGAAPLVGGSLVHLHANTLSAAREEALLRAATPSAADAAVSLRTAHEEALIKERDQLRARRDALSAGIQLLHAQVHGAEQAIRDVARHETRIVQEWLDSLRAALALDAKFYEYYARKWNRPALLPTPPPIEATGAIFPIRKRRTS